jgi:hypothetical protein
MLSTAVSILAAIALLMPGFIIAELSVARLARLSRSDLELALRALVYTLIVHLAFGFWTAHLIKSVGPLEDWMDHVGAISAYVAIVLLGKRRIRLRLSAVAQGRRVDHRRACRPHRRFTSACGWHLRPALRIWPNPQPHDIFLEALYKVEVDENGIRNLAERVDPERGVYIAASQIARVDLVPEGPATL